MSNPFFSVIMPSYLGKYKHAAANREHKLVRAINSVLEQEDFELILIADDCQDTIDIVKENFGGNKDIRMFRAPHREIRGKRNAGAAGIPRNAGLQQASGEYAIYLDIDDTYRKGYLKDMKEAMNDHDWYWMDDFSFNTTTEKFDLHLCDIGVQGACGTSNVCHKLEMNAWWSPAVHYLHDWMFINTLRAITDNYKKLDVVGYQVCHVPNLLDV